MRSSRSSLSALLLAVAAPACFGQHPIPESERWATITHPGNMPFVIPPIAPGFPSREVGRVDHEYQISRTEVTGAEWLEFVNGYAPYVDANQVDNSLFTSVYIGRIGPREYAITPGAVNKSVEIGWRFAARYVNWLHNDKGTDRAAFENGAYDTSTFGTNPDATVTDQAAHSPDARFWIPTQDELVKASHFDPDRYGPGQPGYWLFSHSSDSVPVPGYPGTIPDPDLFPGITAQTSTGGGFVFQLPDVAAYTDVQSPWGLWDTTGGAREWTESPNAGSLGQFSSRFVEGSAWNDIWSVDVWLDQIDRYSSSGPNSRVGLRVARAVPGAASAWVVVCAFSLAKRRRRCLDDTPTSFRDSPVNPRRDDPRR